MKTSEIQKTIDGLMGKRAPLQVQLDKLKLEMEKIRERHEDEIISGKSGGAAHDLRENRTAQEGLLNILEGIDKQLTAAQVDLAEACRLDDLQIPLAQERAVWVQLAVAVGAIEAARAEVGKLRDCARNGRGIGHTGVDLFQHIGAVGPADDYLRQAWEQLNPLNVRNPNKT